MAEDKGNSYDKIVKSHFGVEHGTRTTAGAVVGATIGGALGGVAFPGLGTLGGALIGGAIANKADKIGAAMERASARERKTKKKPGTSQDMNM